MAKSKLSGGEWVVITGSGLIIAFAAIIGSIVYLKPPPVNFIYEETLETAAGEAIYRREGCLSCHEIFGNGASYGPSLDGIGSKRSKEWIIRYLKSPWPGVSAKPYRLRMPSYASLPSSDLEKLAQYLLALKFIQSSD